MKWNDRFVMFSAIAIALSFSAKTHAAKILLIGGQEEPTQGDDSFVFDYLEEQGHEVEYLSGNSSSPGDEDGMDLLIISSTLGSGSVRGKFQDAEIPILQWEEALVRWEHGNPDGNFRMSQNSRNGQNRETDTIKIVESAVGHPLAAGLEAGAHVIFEDFNRTPQQFGDHAPGLIRIAELDEEFAEEEVSFWFDENGDEQTGPEFVLTAIDKGGELGPADEGFFAPDKRVNFPIEDRGFSLLNETGLLLWDASVNWLLGESGDPCDFDGDGSLGVGDLAVLSSEIQSGNNNASFDLTGDGVVNVDDLNAFVTSEDKLHTYVGDANLDGEFNSADFVAVFQAGLFETGNPATWGQGDWNGDGVFNSGDFVSAFQDGGFELGPRWQEGGVAAVPEPSSVLIALLGIIGLVVGMRRR